MVNRPKKNDNTPAPASTPVGISYCLDCGRLMPVDKKESTTPRKYCSAACRSRSKSIGRSQLIKQIAETYHTLLLERTKIKSLDSVVFCSEVQKVLFPVDEIASSSTGSSSGPHSQPSAREESEEEEDGGQHVDSDSTVADTAQTSPKVNDAREETRRAARRLVNFGWEGQGVNEKRAVEGVQNGKVVETSYAKGEWGIRWKRDI